MDKNFAWSKLGSFHEIEKRGIFAGVENGHNVYIARTVDKQGNFVPAKVIPALNSSFYSSNGFEESTSELDVLENNCDLAWEKFNGDFDDSFAELFSDSYIGRASLNGQVVIGKVDMKTKKLIGSANGVEFDVPCYEVLAQKKIKRSGKSVKFATSNATSSSATTKMTTSSSASFENYQNAEPMQTKVQRTIVHSCEGVHEDATFEKFSELRFVNKIKALEMEIDANLKNDDLNIDRLREEQRQVKHLTADLKKLRIEKEEISRVRVEFQEKYKEMQTQLAQMEPKMKELSISNSYLKKQVAKLEEMAQSDKKMTQLVNEKYARGQAAFNTLNGKFIDLERKWKIQQKRIFELESEILSSTTNSDSLKRQIDDYESNVKFLKIQVESCVKKLELSSNDNAFLMQKLSMLQKTMRTYQTQIETLTTKLQSSKTNMVSIKAELARANIQVAKYQAALSSCYDVNGKLMTKVSGMNLVAQHQMASDSALHLAGHSFESLSVASGKSFGAVWDFAGDDWYGEDEEVQIGNGYHATNGHHVETTRTTRTETH